MAQNSPVNVKAINTSGEAGSLILQPLRARNGVFEYAGKTYTGEMPFTNQAYGRVTASVRQGTPADVTKKAPRVKRRVALKVALPILVSMNLDGTFNIDTINVDVTLSTPVEANEDQLKSALLAPFSTVFEGTSPLKDLVVSGYEPY